MKVLAVDTALGRSSVSIITDDGKIFQSSINEYSMQAEKLFSLINECLEKANLSYHDIDIYSACIGPGSFTGVRIGVSAVKGLAFAKQKPFIGITSLEALMHNSGEKNISCAIDASRGQVYFQNFPNGTPITLDYDEVKGNIEHKLICNCHEQLVGKVNDNMFYSKDSVNYSATDIAKAALKLKDDISIDRKNPIYLRAPDAKTSNITRKVIFTT